MMAQKQVLGMFTRATLDGALAAHFEGAIRPNTARTMGPEDGPPVDVLHLDLTGARGAINAHEAYRKKRGRRAGKRAHHAVDLMLAGPPPYATAGEWSREREARWAADCLAWVRESFPHSVVAVASLHRDENSPHVHVALVPIGSDGRLGWERVKRDAMARHDPRGKQKRGVVYGSLHDSFHERVNARYGLARGERGSGRKHVPVDPLLSAEGTLRILRERARQAVADGDAKAAALVAEGEAKGAEAFRKRAAGDEAIAASHRLTLTAKARAGRAERERLEGEAARAKGEAERAKGEAERLRREREAADTRAADLAAHQSRTEQERDDAIARADTAERKLRELREWAEQAEQLNTNSITRLQAQHEKELEAARGKSPDRGRGGRER